MTARRSGTPCPRCASGQVLRLGPGQPLACVQCGCIVEDAPERRLYDDNELRELMRGAHGRLPRGARHGRLLL